MIEKKKKKKKNVPSSPVSVSAPHTVSPLVHHRRRSVPTRVKCNVKRPVECNVSHPVNSNVTQPVKCNVKCPVECNVNCTNTHPLEQSTKSTTINFYLHIFLTLINIVCGLFFKPIVGNFLNISFLITINIIWLIIRIIYTFFYFLAKFLKRFYKYFLFIIFVYVFIIAINEFSSDENFVNNSANPNSQIFLNFKTSDKKILYKPNEHNVFSRVNQTFIYNTNILTRLYHSDQLPEEKREPTNNISQNLLFLMILNFLLIFKNNKKPLFSLFYFSIFVFLLLRFLPTVNNIDGKIILCDKKYFFTIESIQISDAYASFCLKNDFKFYAFSKMKYKRNPLFLKYILITRR